ncbi:MAG TPA: hypothetical protein VFX12_05960 [Vicinamibacterales bacterium]|nr:hypothetical protein [Vicinamibacterales bacterium]
MTGTGTRLAATFRTRAALGLRPVTAPIMVFVPIGILLGPSASGILPPGALAHLDVVISIALATLGVFIGIAAGTRTTVPRRLFAAATVEATVTILVVTFALLVLLRAWRVPLLMPVGLVAVALGICASSSAAIAASAADGAVRRIASQVADLDDVLPILAGGVVLSLAAGSTAAATSAAATVLVGLAIGGCGWLLFERSEGAERGVFVFGALTLLGGAAAYLAQSPLLTGMAAGWVWAVSPGGTDRVVTGELRKVQHPLVVLLLVTAGAGLTWSPAGLWLFAPYVLFRFGGKIVGGWTASRIAPGVAPSDLGSYLIPPGVIGIAFALNLQQVAPEAMDPIVFAVAAGAIACEILGLLVVPPAVVP